jgi:hypothetical protein
MTLHERVRKVGISKQFFLLHVEKPIVCGICVSVLLLIHGGIKRETIEREHSPAALDRLSESAREHLNGSAWDPSRMEATNVNYVDAARKNLVLVDPSLYRVRNSWGNSRGNGRREDPEIFPAIDLQGIPGYGVFAFVDPDYEERSRAMGRAEVGASARETAAADGTGGSSRRGLSRQRGAVSEYGSARRGPAGPGGYGLSSGGGSSSYGGESDVLMTAPTGSRLVRRNFVSLVGLVPLRQQHQEYERALGASDSYDPSSDHPDYRMYLVERVDVTDESPHSPVEWDKSNPDYRQVLVGKKALANQREQWNGGAEELADPRFVQPALTFPLGPMLQKSWKPWATHDTIPLAAMNSLETPFEGMVLEQQKQPANALDSLAADPDAAMDVAPYAAVGGFPTSGSRGAPAYSRPAVGRYPGGYGSRWPTENASAFDAGQEFALFRHFDFAVQTGRKYRYRVRLVVRDANLGHPPANLVRPRRSADQRNYALSPFSEPSAVVAIPPNGSLLAGEVTIRAGKPWAKIMALSLVPSVPAEAAREFLVSRGALANFRQTVRVMDPRDRGDQNALADQATGTTTLVSHYFRSDLLIVDIRGGKKLPDSKGRRSELTEPGALLLLGPGGQLHVRRELDDFADYRSYETRIEEIEAIGRSEFEAGRSETPRRAAIAAPAGTSPESA